MTTLLEFLNGLQSAASWSNILYAALGALFGTLVGTLPGLGPTAGMALLVPLSVVVPPESAVIMIASTYYGAIYGGSTSSVLLNIPGEAASVATMFDGFPLARQGKAGLALAIAAIASFSAGIITMVAIVLLAPIFAPLALKVGPLELSAILALALVAVINLSGKSLRKGLLSCLLGLAIATVGADPMTAVPRFTFGSMYLFGGIGFIPIVVGLYAISEVLFAIGSREGSVYTGKLKELYPRPSVLKKLVAPIGRGTGIGFTMGLIPGLSPAAAAFTAYDLESRVSKDKANFGKGAVQGVAAPEAANNAAVSGGMVPLLTLGIPTTPTIAVLLGAFMIHGVTPGPMMFSEHPEVVWPFLASMLIGNIILLILNLPLVGMWARVVAIPYGFLIPIILVVSVVGVYSINSRAFDVLMMCVFGLLGFLLRRFDVPLAPLILAIVIGPLLEPAVRQSLALGGGSFSIFLSSPAAITILVVGVAIFGLSMQKHLKSRRTNVHVKQNIQR